MNPETDSFARSLAALQPTRAELDPARVFYEAGFAAGAASSSPTKSFPLRMAASLLVAIALAAGGGFYAGHERGERRGYLAAVDASPFTAPAPAAGRSTATDAATDTEADPDARAMQPEPATGAAERSPASAPHPAPPAESIRPGHSQPLAAVHTSAWQWVIRQLDPDSTLLPANAIAANSPLRMRHAPERWEDLVNFRPTRPPVPRATGDAEASDRQYPDAPEPPLTINPSKEWLRSITTY